MASDNAQIAKDKGNSAFKAGKWAEAIGHYSEAVVADRTNPTFPLNRAAAYLKLSKFKDAERDCTTVLSVDPKNVKAFFRRAQARSALERYAEAETDLLEALKLEPSNDSVKSELSSVRAKITETNRLIKERSTKRTPVALPSVASSSQPSSTAKLTQRRVRNVPIEIVEPDEEMPPPDKGTSSAGVQLTSLPPRPSADPLTAVQPMTNPPSSPPITRPSSASRSVQRSPPPVAAPPSSKPPPRVGAGLFRSDGKFTILRSPNSTSSPDSQAASASPQNIPTSHFTFSRTWNSLKTSQERFDLIKLVPPESLPSLFKNNLAPELLTSILQTFLDISSESSDYNVLIITYMSSIPLIPRFDTVVLFFSTKEKEIVKSLWNTIDPDKADEHRVFWKGLLGE